MEYTLLELVQRILSSIKGEAVNSISDTEESLVVAEIVKECYLDIISDQDFPELEGPFELNASTDNAKPNVMTIPDSVIGVKWIRYNDKIVLPLSFEEFYDRSVLLDATDSTVGTLMLLTGVNDADTIEIKYKNDGDPKYYTVVKDGSLIFDSFDLTADSTLVKAKSVGYGIIFGGWNNTDDFIPRLDPQQFNILLKEAKSTAFVELKQTTNAQAAAQARKARIKAESKKWRGNYDKLGYYAQLPNYGRR